MELRASRVTRRAKVSKIGTVYLPREIQKRVDINCNEEVDILIDEQQKAVVLKKIEK